MAEFEHPNVMTNLITFLSSLLKRVSESNDANLNLQPQRISVFHGLSRPTISIHSYLERIFKYANCSPSCFIVAYVYLDRFTQRQPSLPINSFNVHRLLITSVMVAAKFMDDMYYNNAYYAKVGGISTMEMNFLELDFLFGMSFHLNVTPNTFRAYCVHLHGEMLLMQPPLDFPNSSLSLLAISSSSSSSSLKAHLLCSSDEESNNSHHQKQQQQQELAV
ncbi:cyclin-U4-1 [Neltuma alba]|uniref:cyclin-U4-1 n=1 Tax=Neltuma alba TaxID=207710 RepID=UPI0010A39E8E|nr:cyclin-U4-1 [Prosopis alba]